MQLCNGIGNNEADITKLCQLYGVSHYLCMVSMLI